MYQITASLTKENILKKIGSYRIFKKYCPGFISIGTPFKSPFRNEKHPSSYIVAYKGDLLYKDFGDSSSLRAIEFVCKLYDISFRKALEKINYDFGLKLDGLENDVTFVPTKEDYVLIEKKDTIIEIKRRSWEKKDTDYWHDFGISLYTLQLFDVFPISYFSINGYYFKAEELSYSYDYYWENGIFRRKIYQPLSVNKWYSNGGDVVQGEGMLPGYGDLLIITSSLKDVMTLYELGYTAIAPTSESTFVPSGYFKKQNLRFKRIVLFMDSDETGIKRNRELSEKWSLEYIVIPDKYGKKDISDFNKSFGIEKATEMLTELLF